MEDYSRLDELFKLVFTKMEKRVRYVMVEYRLHTNIDIRTVHTVYLILNGYVREAINSYKETQYSSEQIEQWFWTQFETMQKNFIKSTAVKNVNDLKQRIKETDVGSFRHTTYINFPNPAQLSNQFSKHKEFVLGLITALKESNNGVLGINEQIKFFHCLEKFSPKMLGAGMIYFWALFYDIDCGVEHPLFSKNDDNTTQLSITMSDINDFIESKRCLLCNNMKHRKEDSSIDTLKQHLKNCHDILALKCPACGLQINCSKNLQEHMKKIHKAPMFECKRCPESFGSKAAVKVHLEKDHNQKNIVFRGKQRYMTQIEALRHAHESKAIEESNGDQQDRHECLTAGTSSSSSSSWSDIVTAEDSTLITTPIKSSSTSSTSLSTISTPTFQTEKQLRFLSYEELLKRDLLWQDFKTDVIKIMQSYKDDSILTKQSQTRGEINIKTRFSITPIKPNSDAPSQKVDNSFNVQKQEVDEALSETDSKNNTEVIAHKSQTDTEDVPFANGRKKSQQVRKIEMIIKRQQRDFKHMLEVCGQEPDKASIESEVNLNNHCRSNLMNNFQIKLHESDKEEPLKKKAKLIQTNKGSK